MNIINSLIIVIINIINANLTVESNFFITSNYYEKELFCVTNTSAALTWIDNDVPNTKYQTEVSTLSRFASVYQTSFDCNFKLNETCLENWLIEGWELKNSIEENVEEKIIDRRWEALELHTTEFERGDKVLLKFTTVIDSHLSSNFKIPLSIRIQEEAHIFLCDGEQINLSHCYWFMLQAWQSKATAIRKCYDDKIPIISDVYPKKTCKAPKKTKLHTNGELPKFLTNDYWNHFYIKKEDNKISFIKSVNYIDQSILEYEDTHYSSLINISHLIIHSKIVNGFWKIHNYDYLYTEKEIQNVKLGSTINAFNERVCISMFVKLCENCQLILSLSNEHRSISYKTETFSTKSTYWQEIRFIGEKIKTATVVLIVSTKSNSNSKNFWAIDDVKLCEENGIRSIFTTSKKECQLLTEDKTINLKTDTIQIESNCPEDTIGPQCVPCSYFYSKCDYTKICLNDKDSVSCQCSAGYYGPKCASECQWGKYGHGCNNQCSKNCKYGIGYCTKINGACTNGCIDLYTGPKCNFPKLYFKDPPELINTSTTSCTVQKTSLRFQTQPLQQNSAQNKENYQFQLSENYKQWITYDSNTIYKKKNITEIKNLEADTTYSIRAVVFDDKFHDVIDFDEELIPTIECTTKCRKIEEEKLNVILTNSTAIIAYEYDKGVGDVTCKNNTFQIYSNDQNQLMCTIKFHEICENLKPFTSYILFLNNKNIKNFTTTEGVPNKVTEFRTTEATLTSISLKWKKPKNINGVFQHYLIEYYVQRYKGCNEDSLIEITTKTTKNESIKLNNLIPYSKYHFKVSVLNNKFKGDFQETFVETSSSDSILDEEFPSILNTTSNYVDLEDINCTKFKGDIYIQLNIKCLEFWCKTPNDIHTNLLLFKTLKINNTIRIYTSLSYPFSKYNITITLCRSHNWDDHCRDKSYTITTPPDKPYKISQLTVYSKDEDYIKIKWKPPYPPTGILEEYKIKKIKNKYWNIPGHEIEIPVSVKACEIWHDWHCAELTFPNKEKVLYNIEVSAKNQFIDKFSDIVSVYAYTEKTSSSAPDANFTMDWTDKNDLILSWEHPVTTNGDLSQFDIVIGSDEKKFEETYPITKYNLTYTHLVNSSKLLPSKYYTVEISGNNGKKGQKASKTDSSPPEVPKFEKFNFTSTNTSIELEATLSLIEDSKLYVLNTTKNELNKSWNDFHQLNKYIKRLNLESNNIITFCKLAHKDVVVTIETGRVISKENCSHTNSIEILSGKTYNLIIILENTFNGKNSYKWYSEEILTHQDPDIDSAIESNMTSVLFALLASFILLLLLAIVIFKKREQIKDLIQTWQDSSLSSEEVRNNFDTTNEQLPLTHQKPTIPKKKPKLNNIYIEKPTTNSKRVKIVDLENYLKKSLETNELQRQHSLFPRGLLHPNTCGALPINKTKNRYNNLVAYDHSRVILEKNNGDNHSDYINANYINGYKMPRAYIATQGPKASTLNDFWRMIWQENVQHIIMVANIREGGKIKVNQYWPNINEELTFDRILVKFVLNKVYANYEERWFDVSCGGMTKKIHQLHFCTWPDHGVPLYSQSLVPFLHKMLKITLSPKSPVVVHCSAGVGRTGTILLCDINLRMAAREGTVDMLANLEKLREQRPNMVDNEEQYKLAHMVIFECLVGMKTAIACNDLHSAIERIKKNGDIEIQMQYLRDTAWQDQAMKTSPNELNIISEKNRFPEIVPEKQGCLYLPYYPSDDVNSSYINAVSVDAFRAPGRYIVTQQPLPNTLGDFWRLIHNYCVPIIVSLNPINLQEQSSVQFWPTKSNPVMNPVDYISLQFVSEQKVQCYKRIKVHLIATHEETHQTVEIVQFNDWSAGKNLPENVNEFLYFWEESNAISRRSSPIVLTCYDGVSACGLYAATSFLLEKIKLEQMCDVCQAVRTIRHNRSQFIETNDQFAYLYEIALQFVANFQPYSNFNPTTVVAQNP